MADDQQLQCSTYNFDIAGLCQRVRRFMIEALHCQSANTASIMTHDLQRLRDYLGACVAYKDWVVSNPQLDTPETHPLKLDLKCPSLPAIDAVENESIKDWARLMYIAHVELANSQSSRMGTGLVSHDQRRFEDIMAKLSAFLSNYVEQTLPLDLPESVPMVSGVEAGRTGI